MTLTVIQAAWGLYYDFRAENGIYRARHVLDGCEVSAGTPAGLESAIRAREARRPAR